MCATLHYIRRFDFLAMMLREERASVTRQHRYRLNITNHLRPALWPRIKLRGKMIICNNYVRLLPRRNCSAFIDIAVSSGNHDITSRSF